MLEFEAYTHFSLRSPGLLLSKLHMRIKYVMCSCIAFLRQAMEDYFVLNSQEEKFKWLLVLEKHFDFG